MPLSFDEFKRQILDYIPDDDHWSDEELEMLEFLSSPDDQDDGDCVGLDSIGFESDVGELVLQILRQRGLNEENSFVSTQDKLQQRVGCEALGYPSVDQLTLQQRRLLFEYIALTRKVMIHDLAIESLANKSQDNSETKTTAHTTMLSSERTTILMAKENPQWVLNRENRYEELLELNPSQARVFLLGEYAGCEPAEIADLLQEDPSIESWSESDAARELAAARAYCLI